VPCLRDGSACAGDQVQQLTRLGEPSGPVLREDRRPVEDDLEDATGALDELRLDAPGVTDLGCQTGSPGKIASLTAVGDRQPAHIVPLGCVNGSWGTIGAPRSLANVEQDSILRWFVAHGSAPLRPAGISLSRLAVHESRGLRCGTRTGRPGPPAPAARPRRSTHVRPRPEPR
jgi:hypothetical protein